MDDLVPRASLGWQPAPASVFSRVPMRPDDPFDDDEGDSAGDDPNEESLIDDEASYVCQACGEDVVIPIDVLAGSEQEYVEDCPVCCRPHVLTVRIDPDGRLAVDVRAE